MIMKHYVEKESVRCTAYPLAEIIIMVSIFLISIIPIALADQQPISVIPSDATQPTVPLTQQTPTRAPAVQSNFNTSVDFLMPSSPVSKNVLTPQPEIAQPMPDMTSPAPMPLLPTNTEAEEVSVLVSEQCKESGNGAGESTSCSRTYSNGHRAKVLSQRADEGDEFKQQAVIEEYDKDDNLLSKKTIRHRVDYNYRRDQKAKEKELFDITYQAQGKKTTRELMVYKYYLDTGKPKTFTWTQYKQVGNESKAGLTYRASLAYATDGSPDRGVAEQWDGGKKVATFLNWSRLDGGFTRPDQKTWAQWEGWIRNVSLQAYLP